MFLNDDPIVLILIMIQIPKTKTFLTILLGALFPPKLHMYDCTLSPNTKWTILFSLYAKTIRDSDLIFTDYSSIIRPNFRVIGKNHNFNDF